MGQLIRAFFSLPTIVPIVGGIVPDKSAVFGLLGAMQNINNYSEAVTSPINAGAGITLTITQFNQAIINVTAASGAANITLPGTNALIAGLSAGPITIPTDGSYSEPFSLLNNGSGQTLTLVAGDASTTITGNATVATNTRRLFQMTVNAITPGVQPTITIRNLGSMGL